MTEVQNKPGRNKVTPSKDLPSAPIPAPTPSNQTEAPAPVSPPAENKVSKRQLPKLYQDAPDPDPTPKNHWDIVPPGEKTRKAAEPEPVSDKKPEPKTETKKAPEPVRSEVPEELLVRAIRAGLSFSEARSISDPKVLEGILSRIETAAPSADKEPNQNGQVKQPPNRFIPEYATSLADDDGVAEPIVNEFKKFAEHNNKYLNDLAGNLDKSQGFTKALHEAVNQNLREIYVERMDEFLTETGWDDTFGSGETTDLEPDSNEFKARSALFDEWHKVRMEARQNGDAISPKSALKRALARLYPSELERRAAEKAQASLRDRQGKFVARPTQRDPLPGTSEEKAASVLTSKLRDKGFNVPQRATGRTLI